MIALLGKRDTPTDGVEDYCAHLREALAQRGDDLQLVRVPWAEQGWARALGGLWRESCGWAGQWTLVQYTALSWSRHGFSLPFLAVLALLRMRGARVAVVFHDAEPYHGTRLVDRLRRACQRRVMRASYRWAHKSIVTVPLPSATFLRPGPGKAAFVPIGANIPAAPANGRRSGAGAKTVAVFGVTGGGTVGSEIADIAFCMRQVSRRSKRPTVLLLGRDSDAAEARLRHALKGAPVQIEARGILPPVDVSRALQAADALLFVRGPVSTRKGSAMAGIPRAACPWWVMPSPTRVRPSPRRASCWCPRETSAPWRTLSSASCVTSACGRSCTSATSARRLNIFHGTPSPAA